VTAKELAAQAGLGAGTKVRLYSRQSIGYQKAATVIAQQLRSVLGWEVETRFTPTSDYTAFRKGLVADDASGLALFAWSPDYPAPYTALWPLLGGTLVATPKYSYYNLSGWTNSGFDDLISQALRTRSASARAGLYKKAEKLALDDMALIPLANDTAGALVSDRYVNLTMDYNGDPTLATAALK
jgi:ABC-type transport system substrate-binding protein